MIAKAFAAVRDSYGMTALNGEIDLLDAKIEGALQLSLYAQVQDLLLDRVNWFLREVDLSHGLASIVAHYRKGIAAVEAALDKTLPTEASAARGDRAADLIGNKVPEALARKLASLPVLSAAPDIVKVAEVTKKSVEAVCSVYFAIGGFFQIDRIVEAAHAIELADHYDRLALDRTLSEIALSQRRLAAEVLATGQSGEKAVSAWKQQRGLRVERTRASIQDITGSAVSLSKLAVAVGLLADLTKN
jgi:glutamate dehydrogenase